MNDYFLNYLTNPEFTSTDFSQVGLDSNNTSIKSKSIYEGLDSIQKSPLLQTNGKFDQGKFDMAYQNALFGFNDLTAKKYNEQVIDTISYFRDDIFVPEDKRRVGPDFIVTKVANPMKQTTGFRNFNVQEESKWSLREIAEANKIYDPITKQYLDKSPNDRGFFGNLRDPLVLATWDYDADANGNKTTDQSKIVYTKGSPKYDEDGNPYYERLGGRNIYGKQVLSSWDTLTIDGSAWNKFDFFDADDKDSSFTKTLIRDAIKVIPAFIPGINTWYIGARVTMNVADLMAKTTKVFGLDTELASQVEGFTQGLSFSTSDYSGEHTWTAENILNLGADVFTQLAEQRWIFKELPKLYGNKSITTDAERKQFLEEARNNRYKELLQKLKENPSEYTLKTTQELIESAESGAQKDLVNFSDKISKLGEKLSKVYMTGITVADSYGEAKDSGLNGFEAALFTLGYAAAEYGLLNTGVGEQILPELRLEKARMRRIAQVLTEEGRPSISAPKQEKLSWLQKVFGVGKAAATNGEIDNSFGRRFVNTVKDIFTGDLQESSIAQGMIKTAAAHALGEGVEETSEELLLDFSKSLFNVGAWMAGSDSRLEAWDNMADRYGMSFVGGLIGGGLGTGLSKDTFKQFQSMKNMDKTQAFQELVHIVKEGQGTEFLNTANKLPLGNKDLTFSGEGEIITGENGSSEYVFQQGNPKDNMDITYKKQLGNYVKSINEILVAEGAKISDDSLLDGFVGDLKLAKLASSNLAGSYMQGFNSAVSKIVNLSLQIKSLKEGVSDSSEKKKEEDNSELISKLEAELKVAREEKDSYLNGTMGKTFVRQALFEMQDNISKPWISTNFINFAEKEENKPINEIPENRIKQLKERWDDIIKGNAIDKIRWIADIFELKNRSLSEILKKHQQEYFMDETLLSKISKKFNQRILQLNLDAAQGKIQSNEFIENIKNILDPYNVTIAEALAEFSENPEEVEDIKNQLVDIKELIGDEVAATPEQINTLLAAVGKNDPLEVTNEDLIKLQNKRLQEFIDKTLLNNWENILQDFNKSQFISPDVKEFLNKVLTRFGEAEESFERSNIVKSLRDSINNITHYQAEELLDFYSVGLGREKISQILQNLKESLNTLKTNNNIQEFGYSDEIQKQINYAHQVIQLLGSHILAARTDEVGLGNLWGYNVIVNKTDNEANLAELTKDQANVILQNLNKYDQMLTFYENLFKLNSGQKLSEQSRINVKTHILFTKVLDNIVDSAKDDLEELRTLRRILKSADLTQSFLKEEDPKNINYTLSEEDLIKLEKERFEIEDALHKLFNNKDFDLGSFINKENLKFIKENEQILNLGTEEISAQNFVSWLAFTAAVDPKAFYKEYIKSIGDSYAAIPGQEFALKMAFAFLSNFDAFKKFGDKCNEVIVEEIQGLPKEEQNKNNLKCFINSSEYPKDSASFMSYLHTFLVEGIAGSGKSTAIFTFILNLIRNSKYKDQLLNNIWIVHGVSDPGIINKNSEEYKNGISAGFSEQELYDGWRAYLLGLNLGFKAEELVGKCFNRATYLQKISTGYTDWKVDNHGDIDYSNVKLKTDPDTQKNVYDIELNSGIEAPSFIIMDEVTRFSSQDQELSERFQADKNVCAIAAGDFTQLSAQGIIKHTDKSIEFLRNHRNNFWTSPKLGTSLRPNNILQDQATNIIRQTTVSDMTLGSLFDIQTFVENLKDSDEEEDSLSNPSNEERFLEENSGILVTIPYNDSENGLYGVKVVSPLGEESQSEINSYKSAIINMLNTLNSDEQIHYINDGDFAENDYSGVVKEWLEKVNSGELLEGKYKGKIDFTKNGSVQGAEGQYYIAEITPPSLREFPAGSTGDMLRNEAERNYLKYIYTAATRATQGTLIISPYSLFQSEESPVIKTPLSGDVIKKYNETRKNVLTQALGNYDGELEMVLPTKQPGNLGPQPNALETEAVASSHNGEGQDENFAQQENASFLEHIKNDSDNKYNMLVHSMPVNESGLLQDENGNLVRTENDQLRIDNMHGLAGLGLVSFDENNVLQNREEAEHILAVVRNSGLTISRKSNLIDTLRKILKIDDNEYKNSIIGVDYIYKINKQAPDNEERGIKPTRSTPYRRFLRAAKEFILNIIGTSEKDVKERNNARSKTIDMVVYVQDSEGKRKNILDIPLAMFTNPTTMLSTDGFEALNSKFKELGSDLSKFRKYLDTDTSPQANLMKIHIDIYQSMEDSVTYFNWDENKTFVDMAKASTGVFTSFKERGTDEVYLKDGFYYNGEWINLDLLRKLPGNIISDQIYTTNSDVYYEDGSKNIAIRKGHPFILISKDPTLGVISEGKLKNRSDDVLINAYTNWIKNPIGICPVSRIYISSPKANVGQYFRNLSLVYEKDKIADPTLGNMLTTYRLMQRVAKNDSKFNQALNDYFETNKQLNDVTFRPIWEGIKSGIKNIEDYVEKTLKNVPKNSQEYLTKETEIIKSIQGMTFKELSQDSQLNKILESIIPDFNSLNDHDKHVWKNSKVTLKTYLQQKLITLALLDVENNKESVTGEAQINLWTKATSEEIDDNGVVSDKFPYVKNKLDAIQQDISDWVGVPKKDSSKKEVPGIYYNLPLLPRGKIAVEGIDYIPVNTQIMNEAHVSPIRVNGKLDTPAFIFDVLPMMKNILSTLQSKDSDEAYTQGIYSNINPRENNKPNKWQKDFARFTSDVTVTSIPKINSAVDQQKMQENNPELLSYLNGLETTDINDIIKKTAEEKGFLLQVQNGKITGSYQILENEKLLEIQENSYVLELNDGTKQVVNKETLEVIVQENPPIGDVVEFPTFGGELTQYGMNNNLISGPVEDVEPWLLSDDCFGGIIPENFNDFLIYFTEPSEDEDANYFEFKVNINGTEVSSLVLLKDENNQKIFEKYYEYLKKKYC